MHNRDAGTLLDQAYWCLAKARETEDSDLKAELAFLGRVLVRGAHREVLASDSR